VTGANFTSGKSGTITLTQTGKTPQTWAFTVLSNGSFSRSITPSLVGSAAGSATLKACDSAVPARCASTTISIAL
jgi:hypothetical protein